MPRFDDLFGTIRAKLDPNLTVAALGLAIATAAGLQWYDPNMPAEMATPPAPIADPVASAPAGPSAPTIPGAADSAKEDPRARLETLESNMLDLASGLAKAQAALDAGAMKGPDGCLIPLSTEEKRVQETNLASLRSQLQGLQDEKIKIENDLGASAAQPTDQLFSRYTQLVDDIQASPDEVAARPGGLQEVGEVFREMNARFLAGYLARGADSKSQASAKDNLITLQSAIERLYVPASRRTCDHDIMTGDQAAAKAKARLAPLRAPANVSGVQ